MLWHPGPAEVTRCYLRETGRPTPLPPVHPTSPAVLGPPHVCHVLTSGATRHEIEGKVEDWAAEGSAGGRHSLQRKACVSLAPTLRPGSLLLSLTGWPEGGRGPSSPRSSRRRDPSGTAQLRRILGWGLQPEAL